MLAGRIERNVLAGLSIIDGLDQGGRALRWAITKGEWDVRRNYAAIPVKWAWGSAGLTRLLAGRAHLGALLTTIEGPILRRRLRDPYSRPEARLDWGSTL
jgi:hypothetical protein